MCGKEYPIEHGLADFSLGQYYDSFSGIDELSPTALEGLEREYAGTLSRIHDFYEPLLRAQGAQTVLDCGAGNGASVDVLVTRGYDAWGLDLSALRKWQWQKREQRQRLVVANALHMPFPTGSFDAVLSSGVIEHIGAAEGRDPRYRVTALPERAMLRRTFLAELLRVCGRHGKVYVDCPNGSFPIDFWHGTEVGEARWHTWTEGFLPTFGQIRRLARSVDPTLRVEALSPFGRLQFRQARTRWYGRALASPVRAFFHAMRMRPFRWLARSPLNPYLVVRIGRP